MKEPVTRLDDCQYLLVSQMNYTLTNFADHCAQFSHDAINRYLCGERITPRLVWENVRRQVVPTPHGYKPCHSRLCWLSHKFVGNSLDIP